jgi:hypothetical protein
MTTNNAINFNQTGFAVSNSNGSILGRTLTSSDTIISIANATGIDGNPQFAIHPENININSLGGFPLNVAKGGTGATSLVANGILIGNGTSAISAVSTGTNGQLLIGATGSFPGFATLNLSGGLTQTLGVRSLTLTASPITFVGTGIAISGNPASLGDTVYLNVLGGGITWVDAKEPKQDIEVNKGYITVLKEQQLFFLPEKAVQGDVFWITGDAENNVEGWQILQRDGQQIFFGKAYTTQGPAGSITSTSPVDTVYAVCIKENRWNIITCIGNVTIV